ncbi:MAG TPA: glycoside hydrolase family 13 protein [Lachnospiraceae bacterium]|nr:glycoside hydrolase family 13 protein [Lachnospiraceae bacterium]
MENEGPEDSRGSDFDNAPPIFTPRAVFSDESAGYREPVEPAAGESVAIRLRTLKNNVDAAFFLSGTARLEMRKIKQNKGFDYYEVSMMLGDAPVFYYFELRVNTEVYYYNKVGITRDRSERNFFRIVPGFSTPSWAKGAVIYQIYTDRFRNGDKSNDVLTREYAYLGESVRYIADWKRNPETVDVRNFYGGDLAGVIEKLDYLQELGVEVIYFNPIFVSPSNHKYDIQDYDHVDPHLGKIVRDEGELLPKGNLNNQDASRFIRRVTDPENLQASDELFCLLTREAHRRRMKIILDGVFNHCGSFNKWMDRERIYENEKGYAKGAYIDQQSPYHSFFKFYNDHAWPYNEFYDGWWGHNTLPKLNYEESPDLFNYIMKIAAKWVSPPFNADGWRLDVAADLGHSREYNHYFWREFRKTVKKANPDAIILAEHYGEAYDWLRGDEWDTIMNYDAFMEPVSWFLTGMEKHSDEFRPDLLGNGEAFTDAMRYHLASFMGSSLFCAMNELDNHDHSRFLTRTNHKVGRVSELGSAAAGEDINPAVMRAGVLIQMTFPGAPTLYYGDEAGVVGFTDPDNRRTYPWGNEDRDMLSFYKTAIRVHKRYSVLKTGSLKELGSGYHFVSYGRFTEYEQAVIAVNGGDETVPVEIPVWEAGISREGSVEMKEILRTDSGGFSEGGEIRTASGGILILDLLPHEAVVLYRGDLN